MLHAAQYRTTGHKSFCRSCGQRNFKSVAQLPEDPALAAQAAEVFKSGGVWRDEVYLEQSAVAAITTLSEAEKLAAVARFKAEVKTSSLGNRCGRCGAEGEHGRVNFVREPMTLFLHRRPRILPAVKAPGSRDAVRYTSVRPTS